MDKNNIESTSRIDEEGTSNGTHTTEEISINDTEPVTDFFKLGKFMLSIWGLWPIANLSPTGKKVYMLYGVIIMLITLVPYDLFCLIDIFYHLIQGKWMEGIPRFTVALEITFGTIKVAASLLNKPIIEKYMNVYEHPDYKYEPTPNFRPNVIMSYYVWLYNIQVIICFGLVGVLIMTDVETLLKDPIIQSDNTIIYALPFVNWLPFNYSVSPYYEITFVVTNFWFCVSSFTVFVCNTICFGQMLYTVGQLKTIRHALINIRSRAVFHLERNHYNGSSADEEMVNCLVKWMFKKCVNHHQAIVKFTNEFQNFYSTIMFLQFIVSCTMTCFTILIITDPGSPLSSRITCCIILMCSLWELSVYCYYGNEIGYQSALIPEAIYRSDWYLLDESNKTVMQIMMAKTHQPMVVNIGKFVPLSLDTYATILKVSYSYYTFLKTVAK